MNLCKIKKIGYFRYLASQYVLLLPLKIDNSDEGGLERWFQKTSGGNGAEVYRESS